jgi:signal transduction histidine kinase
MARSTGLVGGFERGRGMSTQLLDATKQLLSPTPQLRLPDRHLVACCALTAAGYYAGVQLGLALTFEPYPISVLWPPNAIVLGALLLAPARWWWLILAAVFPAHLAAELQGGVPVAMALSWFASNVLEALIGALAVRSLLRHPLAFDSVHDIGAFSGAALLAVFVASFVDAGFVSLLAWGETGYWELWRTRLRSNALAALVFVPVIVTWARADWTRLRTLGRPRLLEAGVLLLGLAAASLLAFHFLHAESDVLLALLYLPLPFLLWASLRFGPAGSSAAFVLVAFLAIWGASRYRGPFAAGSPAENAFAVQMFLIFVGATLLVLTAAIEERKRDVILLKRAQGALRASDERLQCLLRATNDVIYDWNLVTGALWWNSNGDVYFSALRSNAGRSEGWAGLLHPEDRERVESRLRALIDGAGSVCEDEYRLRRVDGGYACVHWRAFVVRDEAGKPLRIIGSLMDITDRKRVEEAQAQLAHASRLAVLGELTASIAHEINQPLGAILTNTDAAEVVMNEQPVRLDELRRIVDDIRQDDMRAAEVIRHMRDLLRKRELSMQPFDLKRSIDDVLRLARTDLGRMGVAVETRFAPSPIVSGDRTHLQQVVLNLILNAVDAMQDIPASRRRLGIQVRPTPGGGVEVSVSDSGPGIEPGQAERLFESFFTTKPQGMGLGLSIARSIVEAHGGTIRAETQDEGGARFSFCLPGCASGMHPVSDAP